MNDWQAAANNTTGAIIAIATIWLLTIIILGTRR